VMDLVRQKLHETGKKKKKTIFSFTPCLSGELLM
jgi:hypothetical protein